MEMGMEMENEAENQNAPTRILEASTGMTNSMVICNHRPQHPGLGHAARRQAIHGYVWGGAQALAPGRHRHGQCVRGGPEVWS